MKNKFTIWQIHPAEGKIGLTFMRWCVRFYFGRWGFCVGWKPTDEVIP